MSSMPDHLPAESDAERGALVRRCDELFEEALFMPDALGYTVEEGHRTEYMALGDATTGDSIFLYRDDITDPTTKNYPYRISEELDSFDMLTGEPGLFPINCLMDRYGGLFLPLSLDGRTSLVTAPQGLAERYAELIRTGVPARLI